MSKCILYSYVSVFTLSVQPELSSVTFTISQVSPSQAPLTGAAVAHHLLHVYTHQQSAVISETFPTGLAKGNKAGVQRNIKQKNVSLSCSVTQVIPGLDEL